MDSLNFSITSTINASGSKLVTDLSPISTKNDQTIAATIEYGGVSGKANTLIYRLGTVASGVTETVDLRNIVDMLQDTVTTTSLTYQFLFKFLPASTALAGYVPSSTCTLASGASNGYCGPFSSTWSMTLAANDQIQWSIGAGSTVSSTLRNIAITAPSESGKSVRYLLIISMLAP